MPDFGGGRGPGATGVAGRPSVIMVHGAFCGGWCFDAFRAPFEAAGYAVDAPDLPGHAAGAANGGVRGRSMRDYASAIAAQVRACPTPPVLIGHSLGGLVAQMAAGQAPVAALVLLAPSPPWGQPVSTPVEGAASLGLYTQGAYWLDAVRPDYSVFRAFTVDRLSEPEARAVYARLVPESGRALFEVLNWWMDPGMATLVPSMGVGAPVLALAGEHDRIHSPSTVKAVAARLGGAYREVPGMSHWMVGEPGWRTLAADVIGWLDTVVAPNAEAARAAE